MADDAASRLLKDSLDDEGDRQAEDDDDDDDEPRTPPKKKGRRMCPSSSEKDKDSGLHGKLGRGRANAKAKPQAKKPVRRTLVKKCRGCKIKLEPGEAASNWPGCVKCKRALDNISKQASRQGEKAKQFVVEARADDEKLQAMLASYFELCPEATDDGGPVTGRKRGVWSLVKYVERVTAASGIIKDVLGEMMWEKLWIEHAQTARGGKLREEEAAKQWLEWMDAIKRRDKNVRYDHGGPDGKPRVWVKTQDLIIERNSYMKSKEIVCEGDSKKKGTSDDVDRLRPELLRNHSQGMDFDEVAVAMARNENTFAGASGFILDVLDLMPDGMDGDEEDERDDGTDKAADTSPEEKAEKEKVWVERDKVVSASVRAKTAELDQFESKALEQLSKQEQSSKELVADLGASEQKHFGC